MTASVAPPIGPSSPLFIVLNAGSGKSDSDEVRRTIEKTCDAAGRHSRIFLIDGPGKIKSLAKEAV